MPTTWQMTTTSFFRTSFESVYKRHYLKAPPRSTLGPRPHAPRAYNPSSQMDSAHHQLTIHTHVVYDQTHLRSPVEHCQHATLPTTAIIASLHHEHSANLLFTSTTSEALRTIRIRTNNTNSLPSEHERITHSSYSSQLTPSTPSKSLHLTSPFLHRTCIVLLRHRQNIMRITLLPFVPMRHQSHFTQVPLHCIHDALFNTLPATAPSSITSFSR